MKTKLVYWLSVLVALALVVMLPVFAPEQCQRIRNIVFDSYLRIAPKAWNPQLPVRIVDLDEESLRKIGQWPWPRAKIAELTSALLNKGVAVVAFDTLFAEPDRNNPAQIVSNLTTTPLDSKARAQVEALLYGLPDNDAVLAQSLNGKPVVLGMIGADVTGDAFTGGDETLASLKKAGIASAGDDPKPFLPSYAKITPPLPTLVNTASGLGLLNWLPDNDQIIRNVPLMARVGDAIFPSLALESLRVVQGAKSYIMRTSNASGQDAFGSQSGINAVKVGQLTIPTGKHGEVRVRFTAHEPKRFIPAWQILDPASSLPRDALDGMIVFIGTSAPGLLDQRATPLDASIPGVEVHAQLVEHVLAGEPLSRPDWAEGAEFMTAFVLSLIFIIALPQVSPMRMAAFGGVLVLWLCYGSWYLFMTHGLLVDPVLPSLTSGLVYLTGTISQFWHTHRERNVTRHAFDRFVSPDVVKTLVQDPKSLALNSKDRTITIMFSDLRSFTTLSEGLHADALFEFLNEYLTPMTNLVLAHKGTVDKYIGDAIMAFWNAPLDDANHAHNSVATALAMRERLQALNVMWQERAKLEKVQHDGQHFPIVKIGIGLNSGPCCVGFLGSKQRLSYTVIGDAVNIASRLEGATKIYQIDCLVSEETVLQAPDFAWLEVDAVRLKGKLMPTRLFTPLGDLQFAQTPFFTALAEAHEAMIEKYKSCEFQFVKALCDKQHKFLKDFDGKSAKSFVEIPPLILDFLHGLYRLYEERAMAFMQAPPPIGWNGVTDLTEK